MKKNWKTWALALMSVSVLNSCSDDDGGTTPPPSFIYPATGAYVLNQGSYGLVDGTLNLLNITTGNIGSGDLFAAANEGRSMGDTPQDILVYGSHIYLAVYGSNLVWVLDRSTRVIETSITVDEPRDLLAEGGKVYVSNYNGYVSRIDTTALAVDARCRVGVYPEQMAVRDGYLYVANSYGLTMDPQGDRVSKVRLSDFTMEKQINVGLNPTKLIADGRGNLFVTVPGDYTGVPQVKKINERDSVSYVTDGLLAATYSNLLYVVNTVYNADYTVARNNVTCFETTSGDTLSVQPFDIPADCNPQCFTIDLATGQFYVAGYPSADFLGNGILLRYEPGGRLMRRYEVGLNPVAIAFDRP